MPKQKTLACFRTACDNAAHPLGYNRITQGLYCLPCARMIERRSMAKTLSFAGGSGILPRIEPVPFFPWLPETDADTKPEGGAYVGGVIVVREQDVS